MAIGCNVYLWSAAEQDRLLVDCIGKLARELLSTGACERFTCERFDARGPHVMALFGAAPGAEGEVAARVERDVAAYLASVGRFEAPTQAEREARHAGCNGVTLCSVDREPGVAEPGTYRMFDQAARHYPFFLSEGVTEEDTFWRLRAELALWVLGRLEAGPARATEAGIRWLAVLDRALSAAEQPRAELWGYLVGRLAPSLVERVERGEVTVEKIASLVGEVNRATFARVGRGASAAADGGCDLARLLAIALADDGRPFERRKELFRSTVHVTLQLLGIATRLHLPLYLFAWASALSSAGAPRGGGA
jgi:hypothetical protein